MLKGLAGIASHENTVWLPIFENTQDIPALAEQVSQAQQGRLPAAASSPGIPMTHGYIIRRHGIYTWGADLDEAFRQIEIIEFLLECVGRSATMA